MNSPGWRRGYTASSTVSRRRGRRLEGAELERADTRLLRSLDRSFAAAAEEAGELLACGPGCNKCCHGPFPITRLDAWRLQKGMERSWSVPLENRVRRAVRLLGADYPGDEAALDRLYEKHAALPCPLLDPQSGRCELYEWRPVSCRIYGPPIRFGTQKSPPCRLCFNGASDETIERCRMEPDRRGLEAEILARLGVAGGEEWETLIPFALARMYTVTFDDSEKDREQA
jgi:Fe-S-cluster containining protein